MPCTAMHCSSYYDDLMWAAGWLCRNANDPTSTYCSDATTYWSLGKPGASYALNADWGEGLRGGGV